MILSRFQIPSLGAHGTESLPWRATSARGVSWILMASDAASPAEGSEEADSGSTDPKRSGACVLIRMEPGCGYPAHRHLGAEDVLVLLGGYRDEFGRHVQGDFVRYPPDSSHEPVALGDPDRPPGADNPACVLFSSIAGGIELL